MMKPYGNKNLTLKITYGEQGSQKYGRIISAVMGCLLAGWFLIAAVWCLQGGLHAAGDLGSFLNLILDRLAEQNLRIHDDFAETGGVSAGFLMLSLLCCILLAAVACFSVHYRLWPALWAILAAQTALQLWLPGCPWPVAGGFYVLWAGCALWTAARGGASLRRLWAVVLICALAACIICVFAEQPRQSILQGMTKEEHAVSNLPQGDFTNLQPLELGDEAVLELTMEQPGSYYLKGYTGEVYNGAGWDTLDGKTLAAENALFYWLHEKGFWGYGQTGLAASLLEDGETEQEENTMQIRFLNGAHSWLLLPYETDGNAEAAAPLIGDSQFRTDGKGGVSSYTLQAAAPQLSQRSSLLAALQEAQEDDSLQSYLQCENSYRTFVYEHYTDLDEETAERLAEILGEPEGADTAQVKAKVLKLLAEFAYDENTVYNSEEGDFLSVFLQDKTGWSVHYATAAALMFRYYGIPARYAEGYLVTPADVEGIKAGEAVTVDSGHAHSWMEYYEDGLGWVPFETTGPYIGVMGSDDSVTYSGGGTKAQKPEQQEEKQEKEQKIASLETEIMEHGLLILSGLLILLVLLAAAALILRRRRTRRKQGIGLSDDREAVITMMRYILAVMEKRGLPHRNIPMGEHRTDAEKAFGTALAEEFSRAADIYETARYSGRPVKGEDRAFLTGLVKNIKKKTRRKEAEL